MNDDILDDELIEEESDIEEEVTINGKRKVSQPDQASAKGNHFYASLTNGII